MIPLFYSAMTAFASVQYAQGFTPVASTKQWRRTNSIQSSTSSSLFDAEQASPWSIKEWSNDFPDTLNTEFTNHAKTDNFLPTSEDLAEAEKVLAASKAATQEKSPHLLEREFPEMKKKIRASIRETGTDSMNNYIKTMCNHELLNKNEEIILAREIQILLKWERQREDLESQLLR